MLHPAEPAPVIEPNEPLVPGLVIVIAVLLVPSQTFGADGLNDAPV